MAIVMPRSRSSGALSIESNARYSAPPLRARYLVIAAVSVVLPWSMWPIVPTLTCGFVRSNFFLAMSDLAPAARSRGGEPSLLDLRLGDELSREVRGNLGVVAELHGVAGSTLGHRPQVSGVSEHLGERHGRADHLRGA